MTAHQKATLTVTMIYVMQIASAARTCLAGLHFFYYLIIMTIRKIIGMVGLQDAAAAGLKRSNSTA
jgi:hypothetical protein